MSGEPPTKRSKNTFKSGKWNHFKKSGRKLRIEIGDRGFLATCNFREKDCQRESYNILNTYSDQLYGNVEDCASSPKTNDEDEEEDDISKELQNEIDSIKASNKKKQNRFQHVDTETSNLVFIKTTIADPVELGSYIMNQIASTKKSVSRFLLRFVPVEVVCKANIEDIKTAAGKLFDKHFLNCTPKTYSIVINKRYNNIIQRDDIINELASLVNFKNIQHKVDLKNAEYSVIVEILKGICCLSVLPNYLKWKKYNISELLLDKPEKKTSDATKKADSLADSTVTNKEEDLKTEDNEVVKE